MRSSLKLKSGRQVGSLREALFLALTRMSEEKRAAGEQVSTARSTREALRAGTDAQPPVSSPGVPKGTTVSFGRPRSDRAWRG